MDFDGCFDNYNNDVDQICKALSENFLSVANLLKRCILDLIIHRGIHHDSGS